MNDRPICKAEMKKPASDRNTEPRHSEQTRHFAVIGMLGGFIVPFYTYYVFLSIIPLIVWCVYCFKKDGLYGPAAAVSVVGFTVGCIVLGGVVPTLSFLQVGAVSRMIGLWCMIAWLTQRRRDAVAQSEA